MLQVGLVYFKRGTHLGWKQLPHGDGELIIMLSKAFMRETTEPKQVSSVRTSEGFAYNKSL